MLVVSSKAQHRALSCKVITSGLGLETQHSRAVGGEGEGEGWRCKLKPGGFLRSMASLCKVRLLGSAALFLGSARPRRPCGGRCLSSSAVSPSCCCQTKHSPSGSESGWPGKERSESFHRARCEAVECCERDC